MKIAIIGLGKMGSQFVIRLLEDGHQVIAYDRDEEQVKKAQESGAVGVSTKEAILEKFNGERPVIWLMIPASVVDEEVNYWVGVLSESSVLIDGGNSDFRASKDRAAKLKEKNIYLIDVGTSGGILGLKNGFSMMVGGDSAVAESIGPILTSLSKPNGTFHYFGPSGSGHFVKMVHNAIEYGLMESLAEGYRLIKEGPYENLDLAAIADVWQHGSIVESLLNGLAKDIFNDNPDLDGIEGVVAESGEARWSIDLAKELGIDLPAIGAALDVRLKSQSGSVNYSTKLLSALRNRFGGHATNPKQ